MSDNKAIVSKFRRLADTLQRGDLLVPHLEKALMMHGDHAWPEEYAIKVYNKERVWDGKFHPSSHALAPDMKLYYEFHPDHRVPGEPLTVDTIMTFQMGSVIHSMIQSMLVHLEFTTPEEIEVSYINEEHNSSGTLDARKIWLPNGEVMPLEIKSAGYLPKEPPENYVKQFQVYMDLGCEEPQERGLMLFLSKSHPHRFREFVITRDEKLLNEVYSKWNRVLEAIHFSDPSILEFPCHELDSKAHKECPARFVCRLGPPTGEHYPKILGENSV